MINGGLNSGIHGHQFLSPHLPLSQVPFSGGEDAPVVTPMTSVADRAEPYVEVDRYSMSERVCHVRHPY